MERKIKKIVELILFIGWIPVAILYFFPPTTTLTPAAVNISSQKQWWVVLFNEKKIGYSYLTISPQSTGFFISDFMYLKLSTLGKIQILYSNLRAKTSKDFRIISFSFSITTPSGVNFSGKGVHKDKKLLVTLSTPAGKEEVSLNSPEPPYLPDSVYLLLNKKLLKPGKKYTFPIYDPLLGKEIIGKIKVIAEIPYRFINTVIKAYKVHFDYASTSEEAIVSPDVGILEERSSGGFVLKRVTKEEALKPAKIVNIIWSVAIPSYKKFNPEGVKSATYKLRGINLEDFDLDGGVQRLEDDILFINLAKIPETKKIKPFPGIKRYLKETPFIQTGDPHFKKIIMKNRGFTITETARNLTHWVFHYLKKVPVISVPSALEVLKMKKGDCNEHAVLLTALMRTAGIPARLAAGVVYQDGYFFYHAWVEIYLNSWVPVDPTFNQFPADVSHIRFIIGGLANQIKVLNMINRIKIKIMDYRR